MLAEWTEQHGVQLSERALADILQHSEPAFPLIQDADASGSRDEHSGAKTNEELPNLGLLHTFFEVGVVCRLVLTHCWIIDTLHREKEKEKVAVTKSISTSSENKIVSTPFPLPLSSPSSSSSSSSSS